MNIAKADELHGILCRWEAFGIPVIENSKFEVRNRGQELVITDVLVDDAKQYTCIAGNVVGRANKEVNLVVHGELSFRSHLTSFFCLMNCLFVWLIQAFW